jgi:hypothetical protein
MKILTVERKVYNAYHKETTLRTQEGKVKATFNSMLKQPRKGTKSIIINCKTFLLDWSNVK